MRRTAIERLGGGTMAGLLALCTIFGAATGARAAGEAAARHVEAWRTARATAPQRGRMVVRVSGLEPQVGRVLVALYDAKTPFLSFEHQLDRQRVVVAGRMAEAVFADVPYGNYAVAVVYDRNDNGRLDTRLGVLPTEPLGFSNDATVGAFGPPRYRAAAFDFAARSLVVSIAVR